ncbi:MAG TPA: hypothetical protein VFQ70_01715 [Candidatus Saccharimonadaceae bacterium]|nr:hypothetical protein [Candidatus Saccharimonadaceae bacterium]
MAKNAGSDGRGSSKLTTAEEQNALRRDTKVRQRVGSGRGVAKGGHKPNPNAQPIYVKQRRRRPRGGASYRTLSAIYRVASAGH